MKFIHSNLKFFAQKNMKENTQKRKYPIADIKILFGQAKSMCAFPHCRKDLVLEKIANEKLKQIGVIAHIIAHSVKGPRFDSAYPKEKLDTYDNWILLCPTCHAVVDALDTKYTVEQLRKIKNEHENWINATLAKELPKIGFAELEMITKVICDTPSVSVPDFTLISPFEKMKRNGLTNKSNILFSIGLCKRSEVHNYIEHISLIDSRFPDRLKEKFKEEYNKFYKQGFQGDALFEVMLEFAATGNTDFIKRAAGLAVLTYLFEMCEIFEK